MKILYTITKSEIGGAQVHVSQLAKYMKDTGHVVAIVANPGGWLENEATKIGVRFYPNPYFANSFNPFRILKSFLTVKKVISDFNPDIVHCHSSFAGVVTRLVVRNKIPTIFTAHSFAFTDGTSFFRKILASNVERFVSRYTSKIICVSGYDRKLALRYRITKEEKLVTVYNGVESNKLIGVTKRHVMITNGRLAYPKEYLLLLEAYKLSDTDMNLEIISDGPDRKIIEAKINELGISNKVILLGDIHREDLQEKLSGSKLFIFISKHEGFPLAILEAMSAGLPIIASSVGGVTEELDQTGILMKNNVEEIAKAIRSLSAEEVQNQMGKAAKSRFEEMFTLEKFLLNTQKVYDELMSENNLNRLDDDSKI